ncbi:hypothetical protein NEIPOLOT_00119 [Neisseria polysaccharea ATCC 43768]|nr:hypothetical protein NEIPOLOT_00119 [Neisseria polysaccharea ATCC 43768]
MRKTDINCPIHINDNGSILIKHNAACSEKHIAQPTNFVENATRLRFPHKI